MTFHFSEFNHTSQRSINRFYRRNKQNVSCHSCDRIFIITTEETDYSHKVCEDDIIAAVVIRSLEPDYSPNTRFGNEGSRSSMLLLRSLFVLPQYRNCNLGSQLSEYAIKHIQADLFCLCQQSLIAFYKRLGFIVCLTQTNEKDIEDTEQLPLNQQKLEEVSGNKLIKDQIKKGLCLMHSPFPN